MSEGFSALVQDFQLFLMDVESKKDSRLGIQLARFYSNVVNQVHRIFDDAVEVLDDLKNESKQKLTEQQVNAYKKRLAATVSREKFKGPENICATLRALSKNFDNSIAPLLKQHNLDVEQYHELHQMLDEHESLFLKALEAVQLEIEGALDMHQKGEPLNVAKSAARKAGDALASDIKTLDDTAKSLNVGLRGLAGTLLEGQISFSLLFSILKQGMAAVPAVKFAAGVAGIAAAGGIVVGILGYGRATVIIMASMFIAMILLFIFSKLAKSDSKSTQAAGQVLIWAVVIFVCLFLGMTTTAFAFSWPRPWASFLGAISPNEAAIPRVDMQQSALGDHCPNALFDAAEKDGITLSFDPPTLRNIAVCGPGNYPQGMTIADGLKHYLQQLENNCFATTTRTDGSYLIKANMQGESINGVAGQTILAPRAGTSDSFFLCKCADGVVSQILARSLVCGR